MWQIPHFSLPLFPSYFLIFHIPFRLANIFWTGLNCQKALFSYSSDPYEIHLFQCRKQYSKKQSMLSVIRRRKKKDLEV